MLDLKGDLELEAVVHHASLKVRTLHRDDHNLHVTLHAHRIERFLSWEHHDRTAKVSREHHGQCFGAILLNPNLSNHVRPIALAALENLHVMTIKLVHCCLLPTIR